MLNIQNEVMAIHAQYATSEMANYKIQKLFEKYAQEFHKSEMERMEREEKQNKKLLGISEEINKAPNGCIVIFHKSKL